MLKLGFFGHQLNEIQDTSHYKQIFGEIKYTDRIFEMRKLCIWIFKYNTQMVNFSQLKVLICWNLTLPQTNINSVQQPVCDFCKL